MGGLVDVKVVLRIAYSKFNFAFYFSPPKNARKITQILAVVAVSFGAYIHGTTVVFPAVAIPSLKKSNASGIIYIEATSSTNESDIANNESGIDESDAVYNKSSYFQDAFLPFSITDDDISLIGKELLKMTSHTF